MPSFSPGSREIPDSVQVVAETDAVAAGLRDEADNPDPSVDAGRTAYVALRARGVRLSTAWGEGPTVWDAVLVAISQARGVLSLGQAEALDAIEVCLVRRFTPLNPARPGGRFANVHRGVLGLRLRCGERGLMSAPSQMIARNQSFARVLEQFREESAHEDPEIEAWVFDADQLLVQLKPTPRIVPLARSGRLVAEGDVSSTSVEAFADGLTDWLHRHVRSDGRMTYRYFPSRGREATANNMVRQWLATLCLIRAAGAGGRRSRGLQSLATRNLEYNLRTSYSEEDGLGLIDCNGKVKLGAVAMAALAIVEHPRRSRYVEAEQALCRTVDHLWNEDGSFTTFHRPEGRNDFHNFYPGEALVLWAALYRSSWDDQLLKRIMRTFEYYRAWHLANRNPAFVPWHTQAYYAVWDVTRDRELQDFVFEMNDWLLDMQQWEAAAYPDMRGQFYNPARPQYGPPHASSTGVYLEGLIDAFRMAQAIGDRARTEAYRLAIVRGLRSVMQLQFRDDLDMFYIAKKDRVRGGLRTTTYDNSIRIDNVQHNLMAALRILDRFDEKDYAGHPLAAGEESRVDRAIGPDHNHATPAVGASNSANAPQ